MLLPKSATKAVLTGANTVHFLDSPEQALLVIPCWSDVESNGGATWICDEGPARIGKHLFEHSDGVTPRMLPRDTEPDPAQAGGLQFYFDLINDCPDSSFHEMTGKKGDVILMHPLMLHSASKNGRRLARTFSPFLPFASLPFPPRSTTPTLPPPCSPRLTSTPLKSTGIITNPPVSLRQPFQFSRADPAAYSLIELKTMYAVGGETAPALFQDWKITRERELVVPERVRRQQQMLAEENERLRKLGLKESDKGITQAPQVLGYGAGVEGGKVGEVGA